jgi:tetratricopeptide (TPR) repeat protein
VLAWEPTNGQAVHLRMECLRQLGRDYAAIQVGREYLADPTSASQPQLPAVRATLKQVQAEYLEKQMGVAKRLLMEKDYKEAYRILAHLAGLFPENGESRYLIVLLFRQMGKGEMAMNRGEEYLADNRVVFGEFREKLAAILSDIQRETASADNAGKTRLAAMDLAPKGIDLSTAEGISDLLRTELHRTGRFVVIERSEMKMVLEEQAVQMSGCVEAACAVQIGKLIAARKIVVGSVMRLGDTIILNARVVDVEKGTVDKADKATAKGLEEVPGAVADLARRLAAD